jgi:hypothetical protein
MGTPRSADTPRGATNNEMTAENDDGKRGRHKQPTAGTRRGEWVTIPNAHCVRETEKALICDLGDGYGHPIPKSQIAPASELRRRGDRGILIITEWLASEASLTRFAKAQSRWAIVPHTWQVLRDLNVKLPQEDPTRAIIKSIADALREDLGIESSPR